MNFIIINMIMKTKNRMTMYDIHNRDISINYCDIHEKDN